MNERAERMERRFEIPILVAALLVIPIIAIEQTSNSEPWITLAAAANWLIWFAFLAEVVVMLRRRPGPGLLASRVSSRGRDRPSDAAVSPASLQALRAFRLLRLLRVVVVVGYARRLFSLNGLQFGALIAVLTALGAERRSRPRKGVRSVPGTASGGRSRR